MVEWSRCCSAEFACQLPTSALLEVSDSNELQLPDPGLRTWDMKRLILTQHNIGPWKVGIAAALTKPRKKNSTPTAPHPPTVYHSVSTHSVSSPLRFEHHALSAAACCYPTPFLLDYRQHTREARELENSVKLPELKVKPITLPFVSNNTAAPSRSISYCGAAGAGNSALTRKLCLQSMGNIAEQHPHQQHSQQHSQQHTALSSAKLPLLRFSENVINCYQKKKLKNNNNKIKTDNKVKTDNKLKNLGSLTRSCSLVNLNISNKMLPHSAMRVDIKKMTISEKIRSKNKISRPKLPKL